MELKEPITINELSKEFDISKSQIHYYVKMGLLKPVLVMGKTYVFEKQLVKKELTKILKARKEKVKLRTLLK